MADEITSLRCTICATNWPPDRAKYATCPECEQETWPTQMATPLDPADAHTRMVKAKFERYLDARGAGG